MEENKNYTSPTPETENDELAIDWMDILRRIIAIRKTLYKAAGIGLVLGIIIAHPQDPLQSSRYRLGTGYYHCPQYPQTIHRIRYPGSRNGQ